MRTLSFAVFVAPTVSTTVHGQMAHRVPTEQRPALAAAIDDLRGIARIR